MRHFDVIVAAEATRGIARDGDLPWRLPGDTKHFMRTTSQTRDPLAENAVIMGRKTWDSLPARWRPLPSRKNVVLSRAQSLPLPASVLQYSSLGQALDALEAGPEAARIESVFVVGGGMIYREAILMAECERIIYTRIHGEFVCDTFFPEFEDRYRLESVIGAGEDHGIRYQMEVWRNRHVQSP